MNASPRPMLTSPISKMKTSVLDAVLIKPDAFRRNTRSSAAAVIASPPPLPLGELDVLDFSRLDADERAVQDPFAVVRARIDADRPPKPGDAAALVDVAVQAERRLVALDQLPHGCRAGGGHHRVAT